MRHLSHVMTAHGVFALLGLVLVIAGRRRVTVMRAMGGRSLFPNRLGRRFRRAIHRHVHLHAIYMFVIAMRHGLLVRLGKSRRGDEDGKQGGGAMARAPM
jgi:hypothetical protein